MSYTPFNAPLLSGLLGDMEIASFFSVKADCAAMLRFEALLAEAEAAAGIIPDEAARAIFEVSKTFEPDMKMLNEGASHDGMAVPDFVTQLRSAVGEPHAQYVHFGSTSQDVIDTSLIMRLKNVNGILDARLKAIIANISDLDRKFGNLPLMARTRMQAALPILVSDRLHQWMGPLIDHCERLVALEANLYQLQFAGPVGTLEKLGSKGNSIRAHLADLLDLTDPGTSWHTDRSNLVEYANWLSLVTGALGKMGQDIVLMAQNDLDEIDFDNAGGSSAMPHKENPIKAESLVTLARFNATLLPGMHQSLVHEQERSGAAWTLEWMLIPQLCVATGAALRNAERLLGSVNWIGKPD